MDKIHNLSIHFSCSCHKILVGKPEGKRALGRPKRRLEDSIRMDLSKIGREDVDWIYLAQKRNHWRALMKTVMSFEFHKGRKSF